jgi:hypothetical protein
MSAAIQLRIPLTALLAGILPALAAQPTARGDLWETTSQATMAMGGITMPMAPQTMKLCTSKTWTRPPDAPNQGMSCRTSDFVRDGQKVTWTSVCTGQMNMTGKGEIIFNGTDSYNGSVKYATAEGSMTVMLSGRKSGECDNPIN